MSRAFTRQQLRDMGLEVASAKKRGRIRQARERPATLRPAEIAGGQDMDSLWLTVPSPPRTKKNSKQHYTRQSEAYRQYERDVDQAVLELRARRVLRGLPLPVRAYNLAAVFYVDAKGESADLFGLLQAIADALESAGVVTNDHQFRTVDGSRIVFGSDRPRVEVHITPRQGVAECSSQGAK